MEIEEIAKKINKKGGTLYLVGGAVRDQILNRKNSDEDYCVTGISPDEFLELFPNAIKKGKFFQVYEIAGKEFAMARKEQKIPNLENGHNNFLITTDKTITIEEDLARRDITINSIAKNVLTNEIIDPFDGCKDIKNKIIRATTQAFKEDPLGVYRVARIAAQLKFNVDTNTIKMMCMIKPELYTLSPERVFQELKKALNTEEPSIFFEILKQADVLEVHFKEINNLIGAEQPIKYHPEGDAYNHTMQVLDYTANKNKQYEVLFAALAHDFGKGVTPKEEYPHHHNHEISGVKLVWELGNRIKIPISWRKAGETACREHMRGGIFYDMTPGKQVSFIERVSKTVLGLDGLQVIVDADRLSRKDKKEITNTEKEKIQFASIGKKCIQEINGKYIIEKYGLQQGIELGEKLHQERIEWIKNNIK